MFSSPCTSRNLNLNSFCNLTDNTSMGKWQPALEAIYGNTSEGPVYIRELLSPMRPVYPDGMAERELINSFSQVLIISTMNLRVRKIKENDLAWLHLQHRWRLWTLPWNQLCVCHWDHLLVLCQTLCKQIWLIWFWFHSRCKFVLALPQNILFVCHWNNLLLLCQTLCKLTYCLSPIAVKLNN